MELGILADPNSKGFYKKSHYFNGQDPDTGFTAQHLKFMYI